MSETSIQPRYEGLPQENIQLEESDVQEPAPAWLNIATAVVITGVVIIVLISILFIQCRKNRESFWSFVFLCVACITCTESEPGHYVVRRCQEEKKGQRRRSEYVPMDCSGEALDCHSKTNCGRNQADLGLARHHTTIDMGAVSMERVDGINSIISQPSTTVSIEKDQSKVEYLKCDFNN